MAKYFPENPLLQWNHAAVAVELCHCFNGMVPSSQWNGVVISME